MPADMTHHLLQTALAHHRTGRLAEAATLYARLRRTTPGHFDACHLGGTVALQQGKPLEAIPLLRQALRTDPRSAVCGMRLGLALLAAGQIPEAERQMRRITAEHPQFHEAWDNLGMVLKSAGRIEEAFSAHQRSVEINPRYAAGWYNLGMTHSLMGHSSAALACHERVLTIDPAHPQAHFGRGQSLQQLHRIEDAISAYDVQLSRNPDHHEARSSRLLALNYRDRHPRETVYAEHAEYGDRVEAEARRQASCQASSPPIDAHRDRRRLRVAFISPDLRTHSVACFLEPILAHLDRTQFEVLLYHNHYVIDAVSDRLRSHAAKWRHIVGVPDEAVAGQIREDAPDIAVDLAGHTGLNRLPLFARRLAPVQITYLGYPNTTGLSSIDYKLTDAWADPDACADAFHTERLRRFAGCAWAYQPPVGAPDPEPLACLTTPGIAFGSFNNFSKISDPTLTLWARVLAAVPDARLVLKSHTTTDPQFLSRLKECGLDPARVDLLAPARSVCGHLAMYARIDIALDTFPYHGTTTTCEALWMQRPVITLAGNRHASRVGVSLLNAIGHREWIARDADDYVRIAAALALDRTATAQISHGLRDALRASPLLDHQGQAERFGEALRSCWRERIGSAPSPSSAAVAV